MVGRGARPCRRSPRRLGGPSSTVDYLNQAPAAVPPAASRLDAGRLHVLRHYATVLRTTLLVVARRKRTDRCLISYNTSSFTTLLFARLDNWFIMQ